MAKLRELILAHPLQAVAASGILGLILGALLG